MEVRDGADGLRGGLFIGGGGLVHGGEAAARYFIGGQGYAGTKLLPHSCPS